MEEKKMPTWLIIVLSVLGTCLVGCCVYLGVKHFKGEEQPNSGQEKPSSNQIEEPSSSTENVDVEDANFPEKAKLKGEILNYPQKNELEWLLEDGYKISCENSEESECEKAKITINNTQLYWNEGYDASDRELSIFKYNDYYIVYSGHDYVYTANIYKNDSLVYQIKLGIERVYSDYKKPFSTPLVANNSKLYFVTFEKDEDGDAFFECKYQYIDLNASNVKANIIQTFTSVNDEYFY